MNFKDKVALVTGGTSGIRKEIVNELIAKGCKVITCYSNNVENAKILEKEINSENLFILKCDVSKEDQVVHMFKIIKEKYGNLDYLVNNAGTFIDNLIKNFNIDDFKKVLDINLLGKATLYNHINSAIDAFNVRCDINRLIPEIKKILKIKYNLKIVNNNPMILKKVY